MHTDAIHDVLYALHKTRPISDDALSNNFERKRKRIANSLRWALGLCFVSIMLVAAWPVLPWSVESGLAATMNWLVGLLYIIGALYVVIDVWPLARDLGRFNVFAYQQRQLIAAHDIQNAQHSCASRCRS